MTAYLKLRAAARAAGHSNIVVAKIEALLDDELASKSPFSGLARAILDDPEAFGLPQ